MPRNNARADPRFKKAVEFSLKHPTLTVPDAMKLADFSRRDQACRAKRMMVYRELDKAKSKQGKGNAFVTLPPQSVTISRSCGERGTLSSVTMSQSNTSPPAAVAIKKPRATVKAAQLRQAKAAQKKKEHNAAFKRATIMYDCERKKGDGGMSARAVVELIRFDTHVQLCARTIQKKVKEGEIGVSPLRRGPKGNIPDRHYNNLCMAFKSFVTINQLNGNVRVLSQKRLWPLVKKVIYGEADFDGRELVRRVLRDTGIELSVIKSYNAEDRRIRWTNEDNINMWFENWENDLVELGFAWRDETTRKVHIPDEMLRLIVNFDETCLSLCGATTNRGGRPEALIYDPRFPMVGKATSKSSLTTTMITGSTAAGEALPPHIQFATKAKTPDAMRLDFDVVEHVPQVLGRFGCEEERAWPVAFGQNEKGGMNDEEFEKYLMNSIVPLFPHAKDKKGHRVMLKVDSGPGRLSLKLLAKLRLQGFILYPCVPNTTHVTQETDQCYGPFKTQFLSNLDLIVDARLLLKKSLSLQPKFVGLPLFGGVDHETELQVELGAFQKGFTRSKCLAAWKKVGAATAEGVTRACLNNKQVMMSLGGNEDENSRTRWSIQNANDLAIHALTQGGYDAQWLKATLEEKREEERQITQPNTVERRQALVNVRTHGGRFHVTGGMHVTSDDFFISHEIGTNRSVREAEEKDKKRRLQLQTTEEKALAIIAQGKSVDMLTVTELDTLLAWHQAAKIKGAKRVDKLEQWKKILSDEQQPPEYERWTEEDDERLLALQRTNIDIKDTQYGRELALKERELEAAAEKMSREKRDALRRKFDEMDAEDALNTLASVASERAQVTTSADGEIGAVYSI